MTSLTINGYTGFKTTVIDTLDTKFLPKSHQFGESGNYCYGSAKVEDGKLVWDGQSEGMEPAIRTSDGEAMAHLVSSDIGFIDCGGAMAIHTNVFNQFPDGIYPISYASQMSSDTVKAFLSVNDSIGLFVVLEDNANLMGMATFPKKGVYIDGSSVLAYGSLWRLSVEGYEFKENDIKTIEPQYLPVATATTAGMMSPEDKAKLDSLLSVEGVGF